MNAASFIILIAVIGAVWYALRTLRRGGGGSCSGSQCGCGCARCPRSSGR